MLKDSRLPSHYFPAYLKLDLGLGLSSADPLILALDEAFEKISEDVFLKTWSLQPDLYPEERQRSFLKSLGFESRHLNSEEVSRFYQRRSEILKFRGSLKSLEILADIYLGSAEIRRGRPYLKQVFPKRGAERFVLGDGNDAISIVFIRYKKDLPKEKVAEFQKNAERLIPKSFRLEISGHIDRKNVQRVGFDLSKDVLKERRL